MTEINRIGLNPANVFNNNQPQTKPEAQDEKEEQTQAQELPDRTVDNSVVDSFMAQQAMLNMVSMQAPKQTPVGIAVGEMFDEAVSAVVAGLIENANIEKLDKADAYRAQHPGIDARMDSAMKAYEDEVGAFSAFLN